MISRLRRLGSMPASAERRLDARRRSPRCWISRAETFTQRKRLGPRDRPPARRPARHASREDPAADRQDRAVLLGDLDELAGRDDPARRGAASGPAPRRRPCCRVVERRRSAGRRARSWPELDRASGAGPPSSWRSRIAACMPGSKIAKPALPLAFAMYIATSALRTRSAALSAASRALAMPMLAVTETCWSPMQVRRPELADEPLGHRERTRFRSGASSVRIANSSPPRRATRSPSRTEPAIRSVTATSSASPAGVAERVVDDLEVVEVDEQDGADRGRRIARSPARRGRARGSAGTSGGWPRRSASRARRGPGRCAAGRRCGG